jgi:hypothetical protein
MALTDYEVQSLRAHLGFGNVGANAYPYTPDGFREVFRDVIAPNLEDGPETTAATAITAGSTTTVTPASMTGITVGARLVVDVGDDAEIVLVRSVTLTTFTAKFALAHPASGYPVAVMSGVQRVRLLLHACDKAWQTANSSTVSESAGLKKVDEIEWFAPGAVRLETRAHYRDIVWALSDLVRVEPAWAHTKRKRNNLEPY